MNNKEYVRQILGLMKHRQINARTKKDTSSRKEAMTSKKEKKEKTDRILMPITYSTNVPNIGKTQTLFSHYPLWWYTGGKRYTRPIAL